MGRESSYDAAFTLLEMLVALMVLAISYAALAQTINSTLSQARSGTDLVHAVELAERLYLEQNASQNPQPNGRDGAYGLDWTIDLQSIESSADAGPMLMRLATIRVRKPKSPVDLRVLRSVKQSADGLN